MLDPAIRESCGLVVLDFAPCPPRAVFELYERLALLLCAKQALDAVLLRAGREDAELHFALEDALRTTARVTGGLAPLRVAVVGSDPVLGGVCRAMRPTLRALGCDVRYFAIEDAASAWLRAAEGRPVMPLSCPA